MPWFFALAIAAAGLTGLEVFVRAHGFVPSVTDDRYLWTWERMKVSDGSKRTVAVLGSSRIELAWSPHAARELLGERTISLLAVEGTAPVATLASLAADESFRGLALVDIAETHFLRKAWRRQRPHVLTYDRRWLAPGAMAERWLATRVQERLALASAGGRATLVSLLASGEWRAPPPVVTSADRSRVVDYSPAQLAKVQARRLKKVKPVKKAANLERWLKDVRAVERFVTTIRARGGEVVYVRMPTCDKRWAADEVLMPKRDFWDRLPQETRATTVHFKDEPALADFTCFDTSHIASSDAPAFTRALLTLLVDRGVIAP